MSKPSELIAIENGLEFIKSQVDKNNELKEALIKKYCPFRVGEIHICNGFSYRGDKFIVEKVIASSRPCVPSRPLYESFVQPKYFVAIGSNIKKDGQKGSRRLIREILIEKTIEMPKQGE